MENFMVHCEDCIFFDKEDSVCMMDNTRTTESFCCPLGQRKFNNY